MTTRKLIAAFSIALAVAAAPAASAAVPDYIAKAVADPSRPADDRKLDERRKPAEVFAYADVKPGETVVVAGQLQLAPGTKVVAQASDTGTPPQSGGGASASH